MAKHGLREGSVLSPILYAIFIDEMAKEIGAACAGVATGSTHVKVLMYAGDVVIISDNAKDLQNGLDLA